MTKKLSDKILNELEQWLKPQIGVRLSPEQMREMTFHHGKLMGLMREVDQLEKIKPISA